MMNMIAFDYVAGRNMKHLVEIIIRRGFFDDSYINYKADYDLSIQFELQHLQGIHRAGKQKNTIIIPGQIIKLKRAKIKNLDTQEYEDIKGAKMIEGQVKMISKNPVKLRKSDGSEVAKKIMVTCHLLRRSSSLLKCP